jgi:hypothetical protein
LRDTATAIPLETDSEGGEDGGEDEESEWNGEEDDDESLSEDEKEEKDKHNGKTCDHERRPKHKKPMPSLLALAERGILKLTKAIDGRRVTARYCCGGRVRSLPPPAFPFPDEKPRKVLRLTMRWDDAEDR